jgi:hypothetical protein
MECRSAVTTRRLVILFALITCAAPASAAERVLVLVVSAASPVEHLDSIDVRKLFLGLPVMVGNRSLHPVDNFSDPLLRETFLQAVVAMTQWAYDQRILSQVNDEGRPRPLELESLNTVLRTLEADPQAVSFAWLKDVADNARLRIVRVLWQE